MTLIYYTPEHFPYRYYLKYHPKDIDPFTT
jgi:hypothetical protein